MGKYAAGGELKPPITGLFLDQLVITMLPCIPFSIIKMGNFHVLPRVLELG